ncbi:MAG TPA: YqgE/AlgH family protein [Flavobacterium sp.]|nr:YqgE/AlgH family protein [Flavobacterium sp.]
MAIKIIQKGKLLLSEPSLLQDVTFGRSVLLIAEHNAKGSIGFILNKPTEYGLSDLFQDLHMNFPVYKGGPVEEDNLFYIHIIPELIPHSVEIADGIYWGGDFQMVKEQLNKGNLTEEDIRFFIGYSGWGANQLEEEIDQNSWVLTSNTHKSNILSRASSSLWKNQLESLGEQYKIWSNAPQDPCDN